MYLKFPNSFLIPVKLINNLVDNLNIEEKLSNKKDANESEDYFIEEGLKDIKNKKIWEEMDEEYSESQVMNK